MIFFLKKQNRNVIFRLVQNTYVKIRLNFFDERKMAYTIIENNLSTFIWVLNITLVEILFVATRLLTIFPLSALVKQARKYDVRSFGFFLKSDIS
jgi:hypothetical protein